MDASRHNSDELSTPLVFKPAETHKDIHRHIPVPQRTAGLASLPEELLVLVITHLETPPPSQSSLQHEQPHPRHLAADTADLKSLTLVSRQFRRLTFPFLFAYLKVDLEVLFKLSASRPASLPISRECPQESRQTTQTRAQVATATEQRWVRQAGCNELSRLSRLAIASRKKPVQSLIIATVLDLSATASPASLKELTRKLWPLVLDFVSPRSLALLAPPATLAALLDVPVWMSDAWSFTIPYQLLRLSLPLASPIARATTSLEAVQHDMGSEDGSDGEAAYARWTCEAVDPESSLLTMCAWRGVHYSEGSSLNNYGSYHYFEKKPPSVLNRGATNVLRVGQWLRRVSYGAVFPHYDSFFDVVSTLAKLSSLRDLRVSLAPRRGSAILDDAAEISRGSTSLKDCWAELERCYRLLVDALEHEHGWEVASCWAFSLRGLEVVRVADWHVKELRPELQRLFEEKTVYWKHAGRGTAQTPAGEEGDAAWVCTRQRIPPEKPRQP